VDAAGRQLANPEFLKGHFLREGRLTDSQALWILEKTTELLEKEDNLMEVASPVTSASC
jgi:serine/threonine-protein phosphatase 2B catalytic subunit